MMFKPIIFILKYFSKYNAFAPYSPILLGVIKEAVSEAKLWIAASLKLVFLQNEASFCHFKISKNQLKNDKKLIKRIFFVEKTLFLLSF